MPNTKSAYVSALSPEYALLGLLDQRPAHGYELHQRLEAELGQVWHISLSQSYNILNRLEKHSFITGELKEQEKLPARRQYHLTDLGRQRFETWLHAPNGCSVRAIRVEFITRLFFARARNTKLAQSLIEDQIAAVHTGLRQLKNNLLENPDDQVINSLGLDLRLRQLQSVLGWLTECSKQLGIDHPVGEKQ